MITKRNARRVVQMVMNAIRTLAALLMSASLAFVAARACGVTSKAVAESPTEDARHAPCELGSMCE